MLNARKAAVNSQKEEFKWLTEHSRNFLAAGYVPKGIKRDKNQRSSRKGAEILGIDGFADKFYNYMQKVIFFIIACVVKFWKRKAYQ